MLLGLIIVLSEELQGHAGLWKESYSPDAREIREWALAVRSQGVINIMRKGQVQHQTPTLGVQRRGRSEGVHSGQESGQEQKTLIEMVWSILHNEEDGRSELPNPKWALKELQERGGPR
ncbi:hypothetical protein JTB14_005735 [Gonioctena quinquepunctata]|nr:hypothetical protein JTB14_005735 [Gonioctena quinquepunctata]